ncbi:hypothetical protein OPV22_002462 [Ensete ventricosum]|uniref:SMARCC C-terminal domain-containing protein n=1 Tax=Ensete ventricosum TaxID=4639 RepID=A0AAV8RXW2_ENSVE|nr:hypothetical protein OPV22_002462 [Ensete ventricosum]
MDHRQVNASRLAQAILKAQKSILIQQIEEAEACSLIMNLFGMVVELEEECRRSHIEHGANTATSTENNEIETTLTILFFVAKESKWLE